VQGDVWKLERVNGLREDLAKGWAYGVSERYVSNDALTKKRINSVLRSVDELVRQAN
jgi:hypothetical protein